MDANVSSGNNLLTCETLRETINETIIQIFNGAFTAVCQIDRPHYDAGAFTFYYQICIETYNKG